MKLIYTASQVREAEKPYIEAADYDGYLMQRAADAVAAEAQELLHGKDIAKILLLIGPGNNGADTIYAGARLSAKGHRVDAVIFDPSEKNLELIAREGGEGTRVLDPEHTLEQLAGYDLTIDGILGTGSSGAVHGNAGEYLGVLRAAQLDGKLGAVLAVDTPSGVDNNRGTVHEPSLRADRTVTFIGHKLPAGTSHSVHSGDIKLYDLGVPEALDAHKPALRVLDREDYRELIEIPDEHSHKYTRGVLGMLTGSLEYPGAALMSVRAALNTGVGMVRFGANSHELRQLMIAHNPETVYFSGAPALQRVTVWAGGSGSSYDSLDKNRYLLHSPEPAILDAGACDLAAEYMATGRHLGPHKILTPHAAELERFLRIVHELAPETWKKHLGDAIVPSRKDIDAEPFRWVRAASELSGATVMLKGGYTLIAAPNGATYSVAGGSPWLATAGSGDTLTGIYGALLAQTVAAFEARGEALEGCTFASIGALAVYLHGEAARASATGSVKDALLGPAPATRVAEMLPEVIARLIAE
ncbi:NAD(P)H-hydrate dehydratase [Rothia mucilaginosa]|uniref:bifunctional ADP-dependent NAD(P)H-hydrate dehydratase/NAD(P)H-hydrate epimerase n=1 Tax=Rothia mucilaginosa TaxID=43675 RepID=UPI00288A4AAC|nr:NAD(P)H-hydrate dehydratase [Rothia mucilaginosa]